MNAKLRTELREFRSEDIPDILRVHREAFGGGQGIEIADLVNDMLADASAAPRLSLLTLEGDAEVLAPCPPSHGAQPAHTAREGSPALPG